MLQKYSHIIGALLGATLLWGCASTPDQNDTIKSIYDRSAQYHSPDRNPIIVIPGILGSRLIDDETGKTVWGAFRAEYANPGKSADQRLIALPISHHNSQDVRPDGVLEDLELKLAGFPVSVQAYRELLATLGAGGYRDESLGLSTIDYGDDHFTCFQFDYDWRLGMDENAEALDAFIKEKKAQVQYHYKKRYGIENAAVKFDIAAHSMGGVLTRYYLRHGANSLPKDGSLPAVTWAGAENVERAILVAPPNGGSLDAFEQLVEGFNTGRPILPHYDPAIIGTFASVYQLLPRSRHKSLVWDGDRAQPITDILDPKIWQDRGWGLSASDPETLEILKNILPHISTDAERQSVARNYQAKALRNAKQFQDAMDRPVEVPDGLELFLVAGDATMTPEIMSYDRVEAKIDILRYGPGDSVVLRSSALMDERVGADWQPAVKSPIPWESTMFLPSKHRKITDSPVFKDNVLYWLLEDPRGK